MLGAAFAYIPLGPPMSPPGHRPLAFFMVCHSLSHCSLSTSSTTLLAPRPSPLAPRSPFERRSSDWVFDISTSSLEVRLLTAGDCRSAGACATAKTCHGELSSVVRTTTPLDPFVQCGRNVFLCLHSAIRPSSHCIYHGAHRTLYPCLRP